MLYHNQFGYSAKNLKLLSTCLQPTSMLTTYRLVLLISQYDLSTSFLIAINLNSSVVIWMSLPWRLGKRILTIFKR
jgi:hypothetical protein